MPNIQRIKDEPIYVLCPQCGYDVTGRLTQHNVYFEGNNERQAEFCPAIKNDPHAECLHFREAVKNAHRLQK